MKDNENKRTLDLVIKIILILIIIILLIHNCTLVKKNKEYKENQGEDIDIIEINCDRDGCKPVHEEIESLSFAQDSVSIKKGDTLNLAIIIKPSELSSGSKLTWKSSNTKVVTVDADGKITAVGIGQATITVVSDNGKKATCTVNVTNEDINVEEIILTPLDETISAGGTTQIVAEIKPTNATNRNLIWTSSDDEIATVDSNGVVRGIKSGVVTITAKTEDGRVVVSVTINVSENDDEDEMLNVYDDEHTAVTWNGSDDLKIFGTSGKIAPESDSTYQFVIKNTTSYNLKYSIDFIETNPYNINMKYKLKKNDTYLIDHYVSADELSASEIFLNNNQSDTYYLEWKWISSENDTQIGKTIDANYGLKIEIKAESTNG